MQQPTKHTLFVLCCVTLALLAGLLTAYSLQPITALAQTEPAITAPTSESTVTGPTTIVGTATDASFQRYELYFKPADAGDDAYIYLGDGTNQVTADQLGIWDTTNLQPGAYDLRLRVVRLDGNYSEYFSTDVRFDPSAEPVAVPITDTDTLTLPLTGTETSSPTVVLTATEVAEPSVALTTTVPPLPDGVAQILAERNVNVRAGPGTDYEIIGTLTTGDRLLITGQNVDGDWWQVELDDGNGWVLGRLVIAENTSAVPVVEAAALAPSPTPEPVIEVPLVPTPAVVAVEEVTALVPFAVPGPVTVTINGDSENPTALRTFLRTMLAGNGPSNSVVTATIGLLPADLPITLTVPPTATVIGAVASADEFAGTQLFLASAGTADDLVAALRRQLLDQGFTALSVGEMPGGAGQVFLSNDPLVAPLLLCSPDDTVAVSLGTVSVAGEAEAVSLTVNPVPSFGSVCSVQPQPDASNLNVLPQLAPPPQSQVRAGGGGSSSGSDGISLSAEAEIASGLSVADLATHYEDQLTAAGWVRLDESRTDTLAWSAWSFADQNENAWNAIFYIIPRSGEAGSYLATLRGDSRQ